MKKRFLLKSLLLLCVLVAGNTSVWGDNTAVFTFDTDDGLTALGITKPSTGAGTNLSTDANAYTVSGVSMTVTNGGTATRVWNSSGSTDLRVYKTAGSLTFSVTGTNVIKSVVFTGSSLTNLSATGYASGTWTGSAASVTITASGGTATIKTITVTYGEPASVLEPTSSVSTGVYVGTKNVELACETEDAAIYYTLDGTAPTDASSLYTSAIPVSATTTIKAIAYKSGSSSTVLEVGITIPTTTYNTLAALKTAAPTEPVILNLTDAYVTAVSGTTDMYVEDASGALDFYKAGLSYTAGKKLNGKIAVTGYTVYKNLPEITNVGENHLVATDGVLTPTEIDLADATYTNYNCQLVKVTGDVTASKQMGDLTLYNKFSGMTATVLGNLIPNVNNITVTGIIIPFNTGSEICPTAIDYNITLAKDMMAYASGNKLDYTESGLTVYTAKVTDGAAVLTELADNNTGLKVVNNGTGVILSGTAGNTYTAHVTTENVSGTSGNQLKGVTEETAIEWQTGEDPNTKYNYILQNGAFYKATGAKLKAGKAYLSTTYNVESAGAPSLSIVFGGETTGINSVKKEEIRDKSYFNLSGQRVANPTKGLYIVNGRKVVIK